MTHAVDAGVLLQDLRRITVQIRTTTDTVLGTGIVVSVSGLVVTCAHVVRAGGVRTSEDTGRGVLAVYLPGRTGRRGEVRNATLRARFTDSDDDLVCLQVDGPLPLDADRVAVLGSAEASWWHDFHSYGYRQLARYRAGLARGTILGEVDPPEDATLLFDPIQLQSNQINAGMSGAAVLDVQRNLVVGLISQAWFADVDGKDEDTAWAVNMAVLDHAGLGVELRREPLPLGHAEPPVVDVRLTQELFLVPSHRMQGAPAALPEWIGRQPLLDQLSHEWQSGEHLVVGLVGFGGEGKSSLARRWLETVLAVHQDSPESVFWWSFTQRGSADDFLTAAVEFVSGGRITAGELPGGSARAAFVAGQLGRRRFVFVLDGLEVMQQQEDDGYGSVTSFDLRDFLTYFATPGHHSLCVITSRAPVLDLAPYLTYSHFDVEALPVVAGRLLLRELGVVGSDTALDQVVRDWGGHALTLTLLAGYLVKRFHGDVRRVSTIPPPDPALSRHDLVRRVLREYDQYLSLAEREFLVRFSVFRTPVPDEALRIVLPSTDTPWLSGALRHLTAARVLRKDELGRISMHPLVRDFYARKGERDDHARRALHDAVKRYYLENAPESAAATSLADLAPVVEAVHHACRSGAYEQACDLVYDRLYQGQRGLITLELNAYETVLSALLDLFPEQQLAQQPAVTDPASRSWVLHETATCLQMLGRLREAAALFRQAMRTFITQQAWHDAAVSCQNMVELHLCLGALPACRNMVDQAFDLAARAADREDELVAETLRGALAHMEGRSADAADAFANALRIATEATPIPALYSSSGIRYAEHLRRTGQPERAEEVHRTNLRICEAAGWQADAGSCHIGLGDLARDAGDLDAGLREYDQAIRIARGITRRDVLIQSLLARGKLFLRGGRREAALADLEQALALATVGDYRLAQIDCRIALALAHHAGGATDHAWEDATRAEQMSTEIAYHWGEIDAQAAMSELQYPQ